MVEVEFAESTFTRYVLVPPPVGNSTLAGRPEKVNPYRLSGLKTVTVIEMGREPDGAVTVPVSVYAPGVGDETVNVGGEAPVLKENVVGFTERPLGTVSVAVADSATPLLMVVATLTVAAVLIGTSTAVGLKAAL